MQRLATFKLALLAMLALPAVAAAAEVKTEHYDLYVEGRLDPEDAGRLLEALHAKLTRYFGRAPEQRLRVEIYSTQQRYLAALRRDGQTYQSEGGVYGPDSKKAWMGQQPSIYYTRQLLLHEATHQFHFLAATDNKEPKAKWYAEGLAEYMGMHNWDGKRLQIGVIPVITLEDYPAHALADFEKTKWDLKGVVEGRTEMSHAGSWALVHFLANKDFAQFRRLGARLDKGEDADRAFRATFGPATDRLTRELQAWIDSHQQPLNDVWVAWQHRGEWIEGHSRNMGICTLKETPRAFDVRMQLAEGYLKAGVIFGFTGPEDFYVMQLWGNRTAVVLYRKDRFWRRIAVYPAPRVRGDDVLSVRQNAGRVDLAVNGRRVHSMRLTGKVGLCVDGCTVRFRPEGISTGEYSHLEALMEKQERK